MPLNGTLLGPPAFVPGKINTGISFNGVNQAVTMGAGLIRPAAGTSFTLEFWLRSYANTGVVFSLEDAVTTFLLLGIAPGANQLQCQGIVRNVPVPLNDGIWHHVAVMITAGVLCRLYVDGAVVMAFPINWVQPTVTTVLAVGSEDGVFSHACKCQVDELAYFTAGMYGINFVPGVAPYPNNTGSISSLWHFDGDALDSAALPTMSADPILLPINTAGLTVKLTGNNTAWTGGTTAALAGGTGASITAQSIVGQVMTLTVTTGSAAGGLTFTNSTDAGSCKSTVSVVIPVNDANMYLPGWDVNGAANAQTCCPGTIFKGGFSGTSLSLLVDTAAQVAGALPIGSYPSIYYTLDDAAGIPLQISPYQGGAVGIVNGLAGGNHTFRMWLRSLDYTKDQYTPIDALRILGLAVDVGAVSVAPAGSIAIRPNLTYLWGDSITRGLLANRGVDDALASFAQSVIRGLNSEGIPIGYGSQGWTMVGTAGSNIPTFPNMWNLYTTGRSRLVGGLLSPMPNYIVVCHGTNDGINGVSDAAGSAAAVTTLTAMRAAAPATIIFVVIPPGRYCLTALTNAVATMADANIRLIDAGPLAAIGLVQVPSLEAPQDGTHLSDRTHAWFAATVTGLIKASLVPPSGGLLTNSFGGGML